MGYQLDLALGRPGAVALLVCCALAAGVLFWPLSRLLGWRPGWSLPALLSLAPILVFTVPVEAPGWQDGAVHRMADYVRSFLHESTFRAALDAPAAHDERVANLLLFVPLGVLGALATRRAVWTAVGGGVLSFGIEGWQAVSGVRVASAADWLYNSGGALAGAGIGLVVLLGERLVRAATRVAEPPPPPHRARPARHADPSGWPGTSMDTTLELTGVPARVTRHSA
ncbi:VanZ family protein [Pseudosporangium ferrugineum]|uniref:VanZ like protein n=1 Tax=Pseudosporangium ferrugineum TaxID=439699 RepID=A0A2T0RX88_9ACTN|nr:VanZ family protein [Pseudosporangium ferrugineum]PRY25806.1 VanZ like protein [Pseudosporangium ferrugineum]